MSLRDTFQGFARFLSTRIEAERIGLLAALDALQTGEIFAASSDEIEQGQVVRGARLLPNVRLANGEVDRHTRNRLMLAFNSPFFPEVLVASSVMGEGVDLHLNCRYVIHHDLDWNPSVIEQRTGRLDRLSSKAEVLGEPVTVFEPFLEGTQDEKQFRVMKDRERWFNIVMGERMELDEWSVDRVAQRVPIPQDLADRLTMRLDLQPKRGIRR